MNNGEKQDFVRTAVIAAVFLVIALVLLNVLIGHSMDPSPPHP